MTDVQRTIASNITRIRERVASAADKAGRSPQNIQIVAVTKYATIEATRQLALSGIKHLGESRPQQLWEKAAALEGDKVHWHLVGHLQRNKVRRTLPVVDLIHSIDRLPLLEAIQQEATEQALSVSVLLEINISGDETKHGFTRKQLKAALEQAGSYDRIQVRGLMAMAHREGGLEVARKDFADVRHLRDQLAGSAPPNVSLDEMSLGMSNDFEEAILEGATIIRVGRALFEGV